MSAELDPGGEAVRLSDDVVLVTPGLRGTATVLSPAAAGMRGRPIPLADPLTEALARQETETQALIEIGDTQESPGGGAARAIGARHGEDAIELRVRPPRKGWEQFVVSHDESDVITWHFSAGGPEALAPAGVRARGGMEEPTRTYLIPRRVSA